MQLKGRFIQLRPLEKRDLELKVGWINDPEVHRHLHYEIPLGLARTEAWFQKASQDATRRDFTIEALAGQAIGIVGLTRIDLLNRVAEIYVTVGESKARGMGAGVEAQSLVCHWGFTVLGLHKIIGRLRPANTASQRAVEKLGFKVEGHLREERFYQGRWVDAVRLGVLAREFTPFPPLTEAAKPEPD